MQLRMKLILFNISHINAPNINSGHKSKIEEAQFEDQNDAIYRPEKTN